MSELTLNNGITIPQLGFGVCVYVNGGSVGAEKAGREASRVLKSGCVRRLARVRPDMERKRRTWRDIAAIV